VQLALLLARLLLAAVFLLAGIAKYADPKGTTKALTNFGLPRALAAFFALVLPFAELGVAAALIPVGLAWYGACAALALLAIFVIGIAVTLLRGRKPDCRCFGQLHSAPVGASTLIRNGVLGAVAAWLVWMGRLRVGPSVWEHLAAAGDNERRLFFVAAVVMCFLVFRALRQREAEPVEAISFPIEWEDDAEVNGDAEVADVAVAAPRAPAAKPQPRAPAPKPRPHSPELQRILQAGTGWPVGTVAPDFTLPDIAGQTCSLQSLRERGKTICLVFSSPFCDPCRALWPYLGRWAREHERALHMMVVSRGAASEKLAKQTGVEMSRVLLQQEFEISDAYGVVSTPAAVLIGPDGRIQSQLGVGREEIQRLISQAAAGAVSGATQAAQNASPSWYADTSKENHP